MTIVFETLRERDKRLRRERFVGVAVRCGWFIVTHSIAFFAGVGVMYMVDQPRLASLPVVYLTRVAPMHPAALRTQFQCTRQEWAELREACRARIHSGQTKKEPT